MTKSKKKKICKFKSTLLIKNTQAWYKKKAILYKIISNQTVTIYPKIFNKFNRIDNKISRKWINSLKKILFKNNKFKNKCFFWMKKTYKLKPCKNKSQSWKLKYKSSFQIINNYFLINIFFLTIKISLTVPISVI